VFKGEGSGEGVDPTLGQTTHEHILTYVLQLKKKLTFGKKTRTTLNKTLSNKNQVKSFSFVCCVCAIDFMFE
jgi:hypothetical protein